VNVDLEQSVGLAKEMGIYAYDAYVLVCADTLKYPLLSLDGPMVKLAKDRGIKLVEVDKDA
jgi:predicted nucleic acid-binding protein